MRLVAAFAILSVWMGVPASSDTVIRIDRPTPYALHAEGFELTRAADVHVEATGLGGEREGWLIERLWRSKDDDRLSAYAWVLDAETRRPVWVMSYDDSEPSSGDLRRAEKLLQLEAGRYEVYFFSANAWAAEARDRPTGDDERWWEMFHNERRRVEDVLEDLESCGVMLEIRDLSERDVRRFEVDGSLPGALISHHRMGDSELAVEGFRLDRAASLRVYGLVEHREQDRAASDAAWIVDADTREVVFDASRARTRRGGGGGKNRLIDLEIELEPGRYLLYYGTDDSHSFERFNANAPWDPFNWGVTLLPGEGFEASSFSKFEPQEVPAWIDLTGIGDSRTVEQAFRLDADSKLWIQALGEYDDDDDGTFYDGAWILDAATGKVVWEMTERNTRGAGGAAKNRMFDGVVDLPRGSYVVYYATDGSHSFPDWNAATPFRPEAWGVSLRPAPGTEGTGFGLLDRDALLEAGNFLVRLVGVGDRKKLRERFTLDVASRLRIYALGEGQSGRMYDYAYIVADRTGHHVWEMDYDSTRHAGGADKNRMTEDEIRLGPGSYEVIYVSDGSHSAEGWNAGPPRDPINWGVTVVLVSDL